MNAPIIKPIILVVASVGYQPTEYSVPLQLLRKQGFTVLTASNKSGTASATDKSTTAVDITLDEINPVDYAGIFFIGGGGAMEHLDNQTSYNLVNRAHDLGVPYGAICISPRILAKAGALRWKRATGWNEDGKLPQILKDNDADYEPVGVVVDGNVVTAQGPRVAEEFAQAIIRILENK